MLKTASFSPSQPRRAETRRSAAACSVAHLAATYHRGYASLAVLPAALLEDRFEHPALIVSCREGRRNIQSDWKLKADG
jgi:hypothetical protein